MAAGNGNDDEAEGPITSRSETERPRSVEDVERQADAFLTRVVESAAGAWKEAAAARREVIDLRNASVTWRASTDRRLDRVERELHNVNSGWHALGKSIEHMADAHRDGQMAVAESVRGLRAEVGNLAEAQGRMLAELSRLTGRVDDTDRRFGVATTEALERRRDWRKAVVYVVCSLALAGITWLFGRAGHPPPAPAAPQQQEAHP